MYLLNEKEASHSALAALAGTPFLSAGSLYANRHAKWGFELSLDGGMLAWRSAHFLAETTFIGRIMDDGALKTLSRIDGSIDGLSWLACGGLAVVADARLWRVDPRATARRLWVDITPQGIEHWSIVSEAMTEGGLQVVASYDRNPAAPDLFTTKADGSGKALLEENQGRTISWLLDGTQRAVMRIDAGNGGENSYLARRSGNRWTEIARAGPDDFLRVWFQHGARYLAALSNRGRSHIALVDLDPETGEETVRLAHDSVDITDIYSFSRGAPADLAILHDGYPAYTPLSSRGEAFIDLAASIGDPFHAEMLGFSGSGDKALVSISAGGRPPDICLFDLEKGKAIRIEKNPLNTPNFTFPQTRPVTVPAHDRLALPAYLTVPPQLPARHLPAIIVLHGGPADRDIWRYDRDTVFLAGRGYALLSLNYRGSTGYGRAFQAAGYGQFAAGIIDDIADAADWLVAEGLADPAAIGVMGGSFGGYAAAMALARHPGRFRCAVIDHAPTDLEAQMRDNPAGWALHIENVHRYFGVPDDKAVQQQWTAQSPIRCVDEMKGSLFLTAGGLDPITPVAQSQAFEIALRKAGVDVESLYFEREGHGYRRWQSLVRRARALECFLARTLGGRRKRWAPAAMAARLP